MRRRLQGLCLLLLGALLGWLSGGEIASLLRQERLAFSGESLWVAVKLLSGLALIFTGLVFLAGIPGWRSNDPEENSPSRHT